MKAEITSLDPCGCEVESKVFEIPLIDEQEKEYRNGIEIESMIQRRYVLKIGGYVYLMRQSGELEIM